MNYIRLDSDLKSCALLTELMQEHCIGLYSQCTNMDENESIIIETKLALEDFRDIFSEKLKSHYLRMHKVENFGGLA